MGISRLAASFDYLKKKNLPSKITVLGKIFEYLGYLYYRILKHIIDKVFGFISDLIYVKET